MERITFHIQDAQKHCGFFAFFGIIFACALFLFLFPLSASAVEINRIGLQLIARGCGANLGAARFVSSDDNLSDEDRVSEWAADEDESDFDCVRLFLSGAPHSRIAKQKSKRNDYRLCIQIAGKSSKESRETCTPWASEGAGADSLGRWIPDGGGWSDWAQTQDHDNPRRMRMRLQKRRIQRTPGIIIEDVRIGVQASDNGCRDVGRPKFTPWLSEGGGWMPWATDANAFGPDCIRIALESRVGFAPQEKNGDETATPAPIPAVPPQIDLWIQHRGKFYDRTLILNRGERATLFWAGGNAESCSLAPSGGSGRSNSQTITAVSSQAYTLTCTGAGGVSHDEVSVVVLEPPKISPSPSSVPADQRKQTPLASSQEQEKNSGQIQSNAASEEQQLSDPSLLPLASESFVQPPQDAPIISQGIRGSHDGAQGIAFFDQCAAFGWTTDTENPNQFVTVRVYADGALAAQGLANQFRTDLKESGVCPDGTCAFGISLLDYLQPHVSSVIRVRAVDPETKEEVNLTNTPQKITCVEPPPESSPADISLTSLEVCGGGVAPQENSRCIDPDTFAENPPGICALPRRPTLSWNYFHAKNSPQSAYRIQTDNDPDFSSPEMETGKITGSTESYILPSGLSWNARYFWRVRAWDAEDVSSEWQEGTPFTTPPHEAPTIGFSWSPERPPARTAAQFTDKTRVFAGGSVQNRLWTFQDGSPPSALIQDPKTRFAQEGSKKVRLSAEDSDGFSCGLEQTVPVGLPPPPEFQEVTPR